MHQREAFKLLRAVQLKLQLPCHPGHCFTL